MLRYLMKIGNLYMNPSMKQQLMYDSLIGIGRILNIYCSVCCTGKLSLISKRILVHSSQRTFILAGHGQ